MRSSFSSRLWLSARRAGSALVVIQLAAACGVQGSSSTGMLCGQPANITPAELQRFLNSTTEMSKTFMGAQQFKEASGTEWGFNPPASVALQQHWMSTPMPLAIRAMKVSVRDKRVQVLLLRSDETVLPLEGGTPSLLRCG